MNILLHLENAQYREVENKTMKKLSNGYVTFKEWVIQNSPFDAEQKYARNDVIIDPKIINHFEPKSQIEFDTISFSNLADAAIYVNNEL